MAQSEPDAAPFPIHGTGRDERDGNATRYTDFYRELVKNMKTLRLIAAALFVFVLATTATAEARRSTPQAAANKSHRVDSLKDSLVADGYTLTNVQENPVYYFVAPKAPYLWGTIVYTFSRTGLNGGSDQVELTVTVQYTETGYAFPVINLHEQIAE